jgi:hypothetical protein
VRPVRAPCGERTALSWDFGALRGNARLAATRMGCVGPARRLHALRALASRRKSCALLRRQNLRAPSDSLQRPIAAPPHRPGSPRAPRVGRCFLPWAFLPHDTCQSGGLDSHRAPALHRAASEVWLPPSRRIPPILREPCGPRASTGFPCRGVLLPSVGHPFEHPCPPAVVRVDSPRPYRSVRTRPASGP